MQLGSCGQAELGATWLHGLRGSPVYELALQRGLMDGTEQKHAGMQHTHDKKVSVPASAYSRSYERCHSLDIQPLSGSIWPVRADHYKTRVFLPGFVQCRPCFSVNKL